MHLIFSLSQLGKYELLIYFDYYLAPLLKKSYAFLCSQFVFND